MTHNFRTGNEYPTTIGETAKITAQIIHPGTHQPVLVGYIQRSASIEPVLWNISGQEVYNDGDTRYHVTDHHLVDPLAQILAKYRALDIDLGIAVRAVHLSLAPTRKISAIRIIRQITGWSLTETKLFVENPL